MGFIGAGWQQMLMLVAVIVVLFGAKRIPTLMRSIGQSVTEFKKGVNDTTDAGDDDTTTDAS